MLDTWYRITQLSTIEASDIMIYTGETSDIRRGVAESNIILARLYKSYYPKLSLLDKS